MSAPSGSSSSSNGTSAVFLQYNAVLTLLRLLYVANLKNIMRDLQQGSYRLAHLSTSGKKAELQDRIIGELDKARSENNVGLFAHIYDAIKRNSGRSPWAQGLEGQRVVGPGNTLGSAAATSSSSSTSGAAAPAGSSGQASGASSSYGYVYRPSGSGPGIPGGLGGVPSNKLNSAGAWSNSYAPGTSGVPSSSAAPRAPSGRASFRPSPFFEVKSMVSNVGYCPEAGPNERKNSSLYFTLSAEHQSLLKDSKYQVRLFCTSHEAYHASLQYPNRPAPVMFPLTCEARINDKLLTANLKGNRKVPGKVPPPNLNKDQALHLDGKTNKVELSYVNTTYQRYAMICGIVQTNSIESLVDKVRARPLTVEMVVNSILLLRQDDEIEAGAVKMTLRCPLSAMRIKVPSRSRRCNHRQCFDADTFFQLNEQTPSWVCPVCNTAVNPDDLILDRYVETILKQVPEDQDSIVVEPDASWHTEDNKYRSLGSGDANASTSATNDKGKEAESKRSVPNVIIMDISPSPSPPSSPKPASGQPPSSGSGSGPYSVPSSSGTPSADNARPAAAAPPRRAEPIVIDLTLSSDEDDDPPPPPVRRPGPAPASASGSGSGGAPAFGTSSSLGVRTGGASSSSTSPSPFHTGTQAGRTPFSRSDASRDPSPRTSGDNAPQPPGRPLASGSQAVRRLREATDDEDEDDDNVVLSPDRRRVRRRIQEESPMDDNEPLQHGLARRQSRLGDLSLDDGTDDDEVLLPPSRQIGFPVRGGAGDRERGAEGRTSGVGASSTAGSARPSNASSSGGFGRRSPVHLGARGSGAAGSRSDADASRSGPTSANSSGSGWNLGGAGSRPGSAASNSGPAAAAASSSSSSALPFSAAPRAGWRDPPPTGRAPVQPASSTFSMLDGLGVSREREARSAGSSWAAAAAAGPARNGSDRSTPGTYADYLARSDTRTPFNSSMSAEPGYGSSATSTTASGRGLADAVRSRGWLPGSSAPSSTSSGRQTSPPKSSTSLLGGFASLPPRPVTGPPPSSTAETNGANGSTRGSSNSGGSSFAR